MKVKTAGSVLLFNLSDEKEKQVEQICRKHGAKLRPVPEEDYVYSLFSLFGFEEKKPLVTLEEAVFSEELMVLYNFPGTSLDKLLKALRAAGVDISLKALLTETNKGWVPGALSKELQKEQERMK